MTTFVRRRKVGMTSIKGIMAAMVTKAELSNNYDPEGIKQDMLYIRWGCTSTVPVPQSKVINSATAIHRVSDKSGFRRTLNEHGLCPKTWWSFDDVPDDQECPLIVRSKHHAQGRGMWVCNTIYELSQACNKAGPGYYINEFMPKVAEFRVFIHQGYVVWVAKKTPGNPDAVAWNVAKGGRFDNVRWADWNMAVIRNALESWNLSKLHFGGVDVMLMADGTATCVEINTAPSQTSPYRQSCVAKAFDCMVQEGNYALTLRDTDAPLRTWKDVIHPALR